jgi:ferredoxin
MALAMSEHLKVDMVACDGHGVCADLLPEWISRDDWGYPILRSEAIPPELASRARWAVSNCPALALRLENRADLGVVPPVATRRRHRRP